MNLQTAITGDVVPTLNASSVSDLIFWTEDQLYEWGNQAAKQLAELGCLVFADSSVSVVAGTAEYSLPAYHIATLYAYAGDRVLLPMNVDELDALDSDWTNTLGTALKNFLLTEGLEKVTVYPTLYSGHSATLTLICQKHLAEISSSANYVLSIPEPLREYFVLAILAAARGHEGDGRMPDVTEAAGAIMGIIGQTAAELWGRN